MKKTLLVGLLLSGLIMCFAQTVYAQTGIQNARRINEGLTYLNNLRKQTGMIPFSMNGVLDKAAQGHADYLFQYRQWGHSQQVGREGFTGTTPLDRVLAAGYSSRHNSENVSSHSGTASPVRSVDGLMGAIYHRFGFLSFDYDEIGIGNRADEQFQSYVYVMGNSNKSMLCSMPEPEIVNGQYVFKICANTKHQVKAADFDKALKDVQLKNVDIAVWPPSGGNNIPPAFYDEAPDPLPYHDVSGYPVSVQFNPVFFKDAAPVVTRFDLFQQADGKPVKILERFDKNKDINRKFTEYEHAIFPLHRLDWNTVYRVEMEYLTADKRQHQLSWQFKTTDFNKPFYTVYGGETIAEKQPSFVVYSPPVSKNDAKSEYQVSFRGFQDVEVEIVDAHTLIIKPVGLHGQALFDFHGRQFTVVR